jgi:hypothetical protein
MRATVIMDTTARTIHVKVMFGTDIDVTRSHHCRPRIFRPDMVTLSLMDGDLSSVKVHGGLVLKSGVASTEVRESETFYPLSSWRSPKLDKAPEWVQLLAAEAPYGVTTWREDAGDAQAL